ncbi:MAG: hypothetical protein WCK35_15755 [Chloroflexota bacterium]
MKYSKLFLILSLIALAVSACAPAAPASSVPASAAVSAIDITFTDAASLRSQLAYGILKLKDSSNGITPEQAKTLIPLWQAMITLSGDTTTATEELTAVQDQITQALTPTQVQTIAEMKITNTELNSFYAEFGIVLPTPVPGVTKVPGSGSGKTEEEKVAARATAAASGLTSSTGMAAKTLLFDKVIEYLKIIAG